MNLTKSTVICLPSPGTSPDAPVRILVVEDDELTRRVVTKILIREGYQVDAATNGREACARLDGTPYALVLTDVCMPGDISGMAVLEYAKQKSPHTEVILMTAQPGLNDAVKSVKSGAFNYVSKPMAADTLRGEVRAALSAQQQKSSERSATAVGIPVGGYRVLRSLGSGQFGTVLLVEKEGRHYAMKIFRGQCSAELVDDKAMQRFLREGEIIAGLNLDGVVHVYEVGRGNPPNAVPYIIMDYVEGDPLSVLIERGVITLTDKLDILFQVATTLHAVHAHGVIHRDIKPSNVLVSAGNRVKLCDFGTARLGPSKLTLTMEVLGTPAYMAPELFREGGREAGPAADLFSLGVLGYELLTGRLPFNADSFEGLIHAILTIQPPPPRSFDPGIPAAAEEVLGRLMDKEPGKRYRTAGGAARALAGVLQELRTT